MKPGPRNDDGRGREHPESTGSRTGGDRPPDPDAVARIDALLAEASEDWKLE